MPLFLILIALLLAAPSANAGPKAFELYPATNASAPTTYRKAAPPFPTVGKAWAFAYGDKMTVKIDAAKVLHNVSPYQFGNNAAWWGGKAWFLDPDRIEKAKQAGIKFWRWPGGSSSDNYFWDGDYGEHMKDHEGNDPSNMTKNQSVLTDDFIDFCRETGSEAIFTANYGASRYASVEVAAKLAANWVRYCNIEKKYKVRYWEIGNEVYGEWEEGNTESGKDNLTGDVYGKDLRVIADAMKKADPDIYIGAVAVEGDNGENRGGFHWWMRDLLPQLQGKADYLILHQYFMWPFKGKTYIDPSNETLFGNLTQIPDGYNSTEQMVDQYAPAEKGIPIALTEFNLMNASSKPCIELINGLFTAEVLGEHIKAGYVASNYWDWRNGLDKKMGGDMAMLATGDPSTPDATPRPSYYAYALFARAFGDKMVVAESSDPKVKIYASRFAGGQLGLILVNENDKNRTVTFDLPGFVSKGMLAGWVLTGKALNEKQVSWNGELGPAGGGGPFPLNTIPAYRAGFKPNTPLQLSIQANSVTGIVLY